VRCDGRTVGAIAERLSLESSTITPLVKRLEAASLVTRVRQADDERRVLVSLTERGRAMKQECRCLEETLFARAGMTPRGIDRPQPRSPPTAVGPDGGPTRVILMSGAGLALQCVDRSRITQRSLSRRRERANFDPFLIVADRPKPTFISARLNDGYGQKQAFEIAAMTFGKSAMEMLARVKSKYYRFSMQTKYHLND
jgi:DNA-binding MarR family transcriptional regulator